MKKRVVYVVNAIVWAAAVVGARLILGEDSNKLEALFLILWVVSNGPLIIALRQTSEDSKSSDAKRAGG